jgi:hypothetical protein
MENIDKIKCILIDFEIADKTLDEAANEILLLFSAVGRSEQLTNRCSVCGLTDEERLTMTSMCGRCGYRVPFFLNCIKN